MYSDSDYLIGLGSYDITGPAADVNMEGYSNLGQIASGIHFRLRARAFIAAEPTGNRVAFVNLDACMASQLVKIKVIERLKARYYLDLNFTILQLVAEIMARVARPKEEVFLDFLWLLLMFLFNFLSYLTEVRLCSV